jgi:hypothetical protein
MPSFGLILWFGGIAEVSGVIGAGSRGLAEAAQGGRLRSGDWSGR